MSQLQIFSYMPNARVYKATIAARLCGVELEIRAAPFPELKDWLWDFNARPLTERDKKNDANKRTGQVGFASVLYKTDKFLAAHPFGTVPAAFGPDGEVGIFESNSIMRTVARLGNVESGIYGKDPYAASRIDSYLDASLVFARDSQIYLLALGNNEDGARYSGIQTDRLKITAYVICSSLAGVSGLLFAYELDSVQPAQTGEFYELYAIAAAVLGGCSLRGGQGAIFGVIVAAAVIRLLRNSINLVGISTHLEFAIIGLVILIGVSADEVFKRYAAKRAARQQDAE